MDLTGLPELIQNFSVAVQFAPEFVRHGFEQADNFIAAFGDKSPLTGQEQLYHAGKFLVLAWLLALTAAEGNVEGMLGTGFAEADTVYDICNAGAKANNSTPAPPPP